MTLCKRTVALVCLSSALGAYVIVCAAGELIPHFGENVSVGLLVGLIPIGVVRQLYGSRVWEYLQNSCRRTDC
eukprot:1939826-Pleurochrysis_carterae.AAC.1